MTLLTAILIFYAGLVTVSFIAVLIWASFAPYGREIPGIGFIEDDPDQRPDGDCFPFPLAGGFTASAFSSAGLSSKPTATNPGESGAGGIGLGDLAGGPASGFRHRDLGHSA